MEFSSFFSASASLPLTRYGRHYLQVSWEGEAECKFGLIAGGVRTGLPEKSAAFRKVISFRNIRSTRKDSTESDDFRDRMSAADDRVLPFYELSTKGWGRETKRSF